MPPIQKLDWKNHSHIALDLDETLAESLTDGLNQLHAMGKMQKIHSKRDVTNFIWNDLPGADMSNEEVSLFWRSHRLVDSVPCHLAENGVALLHQYQKKLSIITARNSIDHEADTIEWVEKYFPEICTDEITFVNHTAGEAFPKSTVCKEKGITLLVDDGWHNIMDALEAGITSVLIEQPWNQQETLIHPLLYRVKGWGEIIGSLEKSHYESE